MTRTISDLATEIERERKRDGEKKIYRRGDMKKLHRIHATWSSGYLKSEKEATIEVGAGSEIRKRKTGRKEGRRMRSGESGGTGRTLIPRDNECICRRNML